jgi:transcriptional regulator with XRE-family HTH domain
MADTDPAEAGKPVSDNCTQLSDYCAFLSDAIAANSLSLRKLALKTGIDRRRLSEILRPKASAGIRSGITLSEFQIILRALDIEVIDAVMAVEVLAGHGILEDRRFSSMLQMISEMFTGLPCVLAEALNEIDELDGSEIRKDWAMPIRRGIVEKVVKEVTAKIQRRTPTDFMF